MCKIDNNSYNESNHVYQMGQTIPGILEIGKISYKVYLLAKGKYFL